MCLLPSPHNSTAAGPLTYNKTERRTKGGGGVSGMCTRHIKELDGRRVRGRERERGVCVQGIYMSRIEGRSVRDIRKRLSWEGKNGGGREGEDCSPAHSAGPGTCVHHPHSAAPQATLPPLLALFLALFLRGHPHHHRSLSSSYCGVSGRVGWMQVGYMLL